MKDDIWEETLEESFFSYCQEINFNKYIDETYYGRKFQVGNVVMAKNAKNLDGESDMTSPHRLYVISSIDGPIGNRKYTGFILSSQTQKANIAGGHPSNIYIDDFGTILKDGYKMNKPAILKLDAEYEFTDADMDRSGVYKGNCVPEFQDFVDALDSKYASQEDTSKAAWIDGKGIFDADPALIDIKK